MSGTPSFRLTVLISGSGTNLQALIDACHASQQPNPPSFTTSTLTTDPLPTLPPNTHIVRVISNRKSAYGLQRAQNANIPTTYHNLVAYRKALTKDSTTTSTDRDDDLETQARENYDRDLAKLILADSPDLVVCAGFMHVLSGTFLNLLSGSGSSSLPQQPPEASHTVPPTTQPHTEAHQPSSTSSHQDSHPQNQPHSQPQIKSSKAPGIINLHPSLPHPSGFQGADAISRAHRAFELGEIAGSGVMVHWVVEEVDMGEAIVVKEVECMVGEGLGEFEERVHRAEWGVIVEGTRMALESRGR